MMVMLYSLQTYLTIYPIKFVIKYFVTENKLICRFNKTEGKFTKRNEYCIKKMSFTSFQDLVRVYTATFH